MKNKKTYDDYDYYLYVDASGCDGDKFDNGSSLCYAVAALLVKRNDILHNMNILAEIKKTLGAKDTDEVKYTTLRRHKNRSIAFSSLSEVKGQLLGCVCFKKLYLKQVALIGKTIPTFTPIVHALAITLLSQVKGIDGSKVLIVIDRMKHTEEEPVTSIAEDTMHDHVNQVYYDVIFRDSKAKDFQLIQVADFLSGILREHFEQYETNQSMQYFQRTCPLCETKPKNMALCRAKNMNKLRREIERTKNFSYALKLFPCSYGPSLYDYLIFYPPKLSSNMRYLFCYKK